MGSGCCVSPRRKVSEPACDSPYPILLTKIVQAHGREEPSCQIHIMRARNKLVSCCAVEAWGWTLQWHHLDHADTTTYMELAKGLTPNQFVSPHPSPPLRLGNGGALERREEGLVWRELVCSVLLITPPPAAGQVREDSGSPLGELGV